MPSPFPGMDPFLEHPAVFPGFHDSFITYLRETLQARLPDPYYAEIGDRVWVEVSYRRVGPDVNVLRPAAPDSFAGKGAVALAQATRSQAVEVSVPQDEVREPFLQIFSRFEGERVISTVEILSPTNKSRGSPGRELYLRNQREILSSRTNLVEIDLLLRGEHTTAVPRDIAEAKAGKFDYHVCAHRFVDLEDYIVYPIRMEDKLPEVAIPLLPQDPPVPIDLQLVFQRAYDTGPYHRRIRYQSEQPEPPLEPEREKWAAGILGRV